MHLRTCFCKVYTWEYGRCIKGTFIFRYGLQCLLPNVALSVCTSHSAGEFSAPHHRASSVVSCARGRVGVSPRGFDLHSPDGLWDVSLFIWLKAIWRSSFVKWPLQSPDHRSIKLPGIFLTYSREKHFTSYTCSKYLFLLHGFTFLFLNGCVVIILFYEQRFLILMQWNWLIISFMPKATKIISIIFF